MTQSKAYVCIDAAGTVAGCCIVVDEAKARHVIRAWLRLRSGCRVEGVAVEDAYRLMKGAPRRRRSVSNSRPGASAHAAARR